MTLSKLNIMSVNGVIESIERDGIDNVIIVILYMKSLYHQLRFRSY